MPSYSFIAADTLRDLVTLTFDLLTFVSGHTWRVTWSTRKRKGSFEGERSGPLTIVKYRDFCCELCKNGSTDRDAVWGMDFGGPKEARVRWGAHWCNLANTTEPTMCGGDAAFLSNYFDQFFLLLSRV